MATYKFSVNSHDDQGTLTWNTNGTLQKLVVNDLIPGTSDSETCNYLYDDLQRLSSSNCGALLWSQTFTYDSFGNIKKSGSGGFNPLYSTTQNQFTSIPGVTGPYYDMNGNLTKDNLNTYTWDPNWGNMLTVNTGSATVTATYDALGNMVEQNNGSTFTEILYSPLGKTAIMNGPTLVKAFVNLPGGSTAIYNSSSLAYYRHPDWLGSSRLTSTQARGIYSSSAYAPFGEQYANSGTTDASFTGQNSDTVSSLYDFPAREQSSSQGRWISPDPAGLSAVDTTSPQTWNRYAYVTNNPPSFTDPSGLMREPCFTAGCIEGGGGGLGGGGGFNCTQDLINQSCDTVYSVVQGGGADVCPNNNCVGITGQANGEVYRNTYNPNLTLNCNGADLSNYQCAWSNWSMQFVQNADFVWTVGAGNSDTHPGLAAFYNNPDCPHCGDTLQSANTVGKAAFVATGVVIVGVPLIGEFAGAVAACNPGLNTSNSGHVTVYCRAWMPGQLLGIGYDPQNGLHLNVGNSIHIPLWPW
jgi:RHS repeat-associated protein